MEQEVYGKEVASIICQMTGWLEALDIRDDGVYVKDGYLAQDPGEQAFTWTPACEMDWTGAPDPLTAPSLPIPFAAKNLAAFILDAAGFGIQCKFGRIEHGPNEEELESLGMRATKVRKVLRDAYNLAQQAQRFAGADNYDEQQRAAELLSEYADARAKAVKRHKVMQTQIVRKRKDGSIQHLDIPREKYLLRLARANETVASLKSEAQKAKTNADARHAKWLKTMVHQLLHPALPVESSTTPASEVNTAEPASDTNPVQRSVAQDNSILNELKKHGFDPMALPANLPGRPGVKAAIRKALKGNQLFIGSTVFNKAWERLTERGDIVIKA